MTRFTTKTLGKGTMRIYERNGLRLHAYQTNDPIDNEVFVVENDGRGFVIEYPCFFDNIAELEEYLRTNAITIEGIVASYHMAGATFLEGTPVYATHEADAYGHTGGGKALIDSFATAFGEAFDASLPQVSNFIEGDTLTLAGTTMKIVPNDDAFDIEIPALDAVYIHMMGHDCHSIVAGGQHADALIAQLQDFIDRDFAFILTSHYTPEDQKDAQAKIAYLEDLKGIAARSDNAASFKQTVETKYPEYAGENYLDMTTGFFFGA